MKNVIDRYKLWEAIKMLVYDTTNMNSGLKGGIVSLIKRHMHDLNA